MLLLALATNVACLKECGYASKAVRLQASVMSSNDVYISCNDE